LKQVKLRKRKIFPTYRDFGIKEKSDTFGSKAYAEFFEEDLMQNSKLILAGGARAKCTK